MFQQKKTNGHTYIAILYPQKYKRKLAPNIEKLIQKKGNKQLRFQRIFFLKKRTTKIVALTAEWRKKKTDVASFFVKTYNNP